MRTPCEITNRLPAGHIRCEEGAKPWILTSTILASSMAFIDSTAINVALPALQKGLHATVIDVQWVVESYGLFLAALILTGGSLGDLYGRRKIFLVGTVIFALASVACGFALTTQLLIVARSIQGIGAALLVPGSLAIISSSFDEKDRGQAIGTWSGFTSITMAVGPVLGGWLVEHASWRWVFFINVPIAAAVILISLCHIPESRKRAAGRIDWLGALLATAGLGGVVYGFIESTSRGWAHPLVVGSLLAGFACLFGFALVEDRVRSPMVPLTLFASRSFSGSNLLTLFLYAALGIFFFLYPMNFIQVQGYSTTGTGAAALPLIVLMFFLSRWSGGLVARHGSRTPLVIGPLIAAAGFVLFAVPDVGVNYWKGFFPAFVVLGIGMAVSVAPLTTVVMSSVDQDRSGAASGTNNAVARIAGVLSVALVGIAMVKLFSFSLNRSLTGGSFPPSVLQYVRSNASKLAGLELPPGLDSVTAALIRHSISQAFIFGFRILMLACAGLALASAAVAGLMIPSDRK